MLKKILLALIGLNIALLFTVTTTSAQATTTNTTTYTWEFARLGSTQLVCKQVVINPQNQILTNSDKQQVNIHSAVVSSSYCHNLTKPQL